MSFLSPFYTSVFSLYFHKNPMGRRPSAKVRLLIRTCVCDSGLNNPVVCTWSSWLAWPGALQARPGSRLSSASSWMRPIKSFPSISWTSVSSVKLRWQHDLCPRVTVRIKRGKRCKAFRTVHGGHEGHDKSQLFWVVASQKSFRWIKKHLNTNCRCYGYVRETLSLRSSQFC